MKRSLTARHSHNTALRLLNVLLVILSVALFFTPVSVNAKSTPVVNLSQSAQQVWQRQQVLITLDVITDDPFARLEVETFSQDGFSITPFDLVRVESNKHTTLTLKWVVFAFIAGNHTLKLPRIRYRPNSGRMQTLKLVAPSLTVRRLPLYVSPTMPVGEISLKSNWQDGWLVTTNNLLEWQVTVEGKGVAKQFMPPFSRQLSSSEAVEILPLQTSDKVLKEDDGLTLERHYTIPLKVHTNGFVSLPEIKIQYFEPNSGKLEKTRLTAPLLLAFNKVLLGLIFLVLLIFLSIFFFMLITKMTRIFKRKQKQKQAIYQLSQATNYSQIRAALNQYTLAKGWGDNVVLERLPQLDTQEGDKRVLIEKSINQLQAHQFSPEISGIKIVEIRNDLLRRLR